MAPLLPALLLLGAAPAARALDLLTLWRQSQLPLRLAVGDWVDYRHGTLAGGPRDEDLVRLQIVARGDDGGWVLEVLPLAGADDGLRPLPGEGTRVTLAPGIEARRGRLADLVTGVVRWQDGRAEALAPEQWRDDPLAVSFLDEFRPDRVEPGEDTVRVVAGRSLMCRQLVLAAADTQRIALPRGDLVQVASREISVAVADAVPLLGVVYAAERTVARSHLEPPGQRFRPPPPEVRVETLELLAYGGGARPALRER